MSSDELNHRVNRIYAALEGVREEDLAKFPPKIVDEYGTVFLWQDFRGGVGDAELSNAAHSLIHNIAHLQDHLRKWAARNGLDKSNVDSRFQASRALLVLRDLSNNDKHGYPPRNGGHSGISPRIEQFGRVLRLTTQPEVGSFVGVVLTSQGPKQIGSSGTARVVITGDVVDTDGNVVGDLHGLALEAVGAIEALLRGLGVELPSTST